jgi:transposase
LRAHNGAPDNIAAACIDMSPAFIKGVTDHLPKATITFDKLHGGISSKTSSAA